MKSLALSLVVAAVVSLGAATASAEASRMVGPGSALVSAQDATTKANLHSQRAAQHRTAARLAHEKAKQYLRIAADDAKQGFAYHAAQMRAMAAEQTAIARNETAAAEREEALAAQWRSMAKQQMAQHQASLGQSAAAHHPAGR